MVMKWNGALLPCCALFRSSHPLSINLMRLQQSSRVQPTSLLVYSQRGAQTNLGNLSSIFSAPVFTERQEKRVANTDIAELFDTFKKNRDTMTFKDTVRMLNDISYVVIPFDQKKAEFKQLIAKIKSQLKANNQMAMQHNFELVEALCRMRVDPLNDFMRDMMREKKLSRSSKDITVQMLYFATLLKNYEQANDLEIVNQLLRELKHLVVTDLEAEQINYLMRAFSIVSSLIESG